MNVSNKTPAGAGEQINMAGTSGKFGLVKVGTTTIEASGWSSKRSAKVHKFATCLTPGTNHYAAIGGRSEHSVDLNGIFDPASPIEATLAEGTEVALKLYVTATHGYTCQAVIETIDTDVDIEDGKPVSWKASAAIDGSLGAYGAIT